MLDEDDEFEEYILFIENVKLADLIKNNDQVDDNLIDLLKEKSGENYNKIPPIFKNIDEWPKRTNLKCWYCSLNFDSIPIFIPIHCYLNNISNKQEFDVLGNFCSFNCAKSHLDIFFKDNFIYSKNLLILYNIINNKQVIDIESAPDKFDLNIYGGHLNQDEYKNKIHNLLNYEL